MASVGENAIAFAVLQIAAENSNGVATFDRCKKHIPDLVKLTPDDLEDSVTRPNEPMWHQLVRNIKSHHNAEGNYINSGYLAHEPRIGYSITDAGRAYLKRKLG